MKYYDFLKKRYEIKLLKLTISSIEMREVVCYIIVSVIIQFCFIFNYCSYMWLICKIKVCHQEIKI